MPFRLPAAECWCTSRPQIKSDWSADVATTDARQARSDPRRRQQPLHRLGIAKACHDAGAEIALTFQGDALKKRVEPLAKEIGGILLGHCDVTDGATIDAVFAELAKQWGKIDFVCMRSRSPTNPA